jgi:outer membrane protein OmpA-like peptidoglycan-associated protein
MRRAGITAGLAIPGAILGLAALTASAPTTSAMAQVNSAPNTVPGTEANPFPVIEMQSNYGERPDHYRHLPFRDLATSISIQLPAGALYDFNVMAVRANAADYLQQAANLIYEHAAGPVKIECRSDRGAAAAAQKLATQCALAISQWLTTQEKLTKVKFVTVGTAVPPPAPPDPRDLMPKVSPSQSNITIDFAKR